ncbi:MAG: M50 family metallopeptidase [Methanoregulaceae archaeon]
MDLLGLINFILLAFVVIFISIGLDRLYTHIVPIRLLYYVIRFPGVVLHEVSHIVGCLCTGARIKKVVLFSEGGGSVTYVNPKIPIFGSVIISTAPLFILPLILALLTWIFGTFFGCYFPSNLSLSGNISIEFYEMITSVVTIFVTNIFSHFNGWFFVYLYLIGSVILSLSPSGQDFQNAAIGISILIIFSLFIIWSNFSPIIAILNLILSMISTAFSLGLMYELIAAVTAVPIVGIYGIMKT